MASISKINSALPFELLLHVFSYLEASELFDNAIYVCREWHAVGTCLESYRDKITHIGLSFPSRQQLQKIKRIFHVMRQPNTLLVSTSSSSSLALTNFANNPSYQRFRNQMKDLNAAREFVLAQLDLNCDNLSVQDQQIVLALRRAKLPNISDESFDYTISAFETKLWLASQVLIRNFKGSSEAMNENLQGLIANITNVSTSPNMSSLISRQLINADMHWYEIALGLLVFKDKLDMNLDQNPTIHSMSLGIHAAVSGEALKAALWVTSLYPSFGSGGYIASSQSIDECIDTPEFCEFLLTHSLGDKLIAILANKIEAESWDHLRPLVLEHIYKNDYCFHFISMHSKFQFRESELLALCSSTPSKNTALISRLIAVATKSGFFSCLKIFVDRYTTWTSVNEKFTNMQLVEAYDSNKEFISKEHKVLLQVLAELIELVSPTQPESLKLLSGVIDFLSSLSQFELLAYDLATLPGSERLLGLKVHPVFDVCLAAGFLEACNGFEDPADAIVENRIKDLPSESKNFLFFIALRPGNSMLLTTLFKLFPQTCSKQHFWDACQSFIDRFKLRIVVDRVLRNLVNIIAQSDVLKGTLD